MVRQAARAALAALRHGAPRSEAPAPRLQIRARARLCLHCVATVSRTPRWPTHQEKPEGHDSNAAQAKAWLCFDSKEFRARFPRELREMMVQLPKSVLTHLASATAAGRQAARHSAPHGAARRGAARAGRQACNLCVFTMEGRRWRPP